TASCGMPQFGTSWKWGGRHSRTLYTPSKRKMRTARIPLPASVICSRSRPLLRFDGKDYCRDNGISNEGGFAFFRRRNEILIHVPWKRDLIHILYYRIP